MVQRPQEQDSHPTRPNCEAKNSGGDDPSHASNHAHSRSPVLLVLKSRLKLAGALAERQSISAWEKRRGSSASQNAKAGGSAGGGVEQPARVNRPAKISIGYRVNFRIACYLLSQQFHAGLLSP